MAGVQGDVSRHDPSAWPVPRSSFVMPVSDAFRSRREGSGGSARFRIRGGRLAGAACIPDQRAASFNWTGQEEAVLGCRAGQESGTDALR